MWQQQLNQQTSIVLQEVSQYQGLLSASVEDCRREAYQLSMWLKEPWQESETDRQELQAAWQRLQELRLAAKQCQETVDQLKHACEATFIIDESSEMQLGTGGAETPLCVLPSSSTSANPAVTDLTNDDAMWAPCDLLQCSMVQCQHSRFCWL